MIRLPFPRYDRLYPLHFAAMCDDVIEVANLLDHYEVDIVDMSGDTPLLRAIQHCALNAFYFLLISGADIYKRGRLGRTPFYEALNHSPEFVRILVYVKGREILRNYDSLTPLQQLVVNIAEHRLEDNKGEVITVGR